MVYSAETAHEHDALRCRVERPCTGPANTPGRSFRDRGDHELWVCGGVRVPIPRHREINEITALEIMKRLEEVLGQRWWR